MVFGIGTWLCWPPTGRIALCQVGLDPIGPTLFGICRHTLPETRHELRGSGGQRCGNGANCLGHYRPIEFSAWQVHCICATPRLCATVLVTGLDTSRRTNGKKNAILKIKIFGNFKVVGKPPIVIDRVEPHALTTAMHFRDLRRKYAHPIIVLNLVKRDEHKHNENLLHDIFLKVFN